MDEAIKKTSHNDSRIRSDLSYASVGGTAEEGELIERTHVTTITMRLTVPSEFMACGPFLYTWPMEEEKRK